MSLFGVVFALITCAARRPPLRPPSLIQEVETAAIDDRAEAISILQAYLSDSPSSGVEPWALLWLGEQHRLNRSTEQARRQFELLADRYPTHDLKEAALLGMAVVDAGQSPSGNTLATLQLLDAPGSPDTLQADRYRILARVAADDGASTVRVRELVDKAIQYAESDPSVKIRIHQTLSDLLSDAQSEGLSGISGIGVGADAEQTTYERAETALERNDFSEAIEFSRRFLELWPSSDRAAEVEFFIKRAEQADPLSLRKVGVLLPLSGRFSPAARQIKEVIEMANRRDGNPIQLVFADTKGEEATALLELERLVLEEGCVAILGPLLKNEVMPVAEAAQVMHVPLVALSQAKNPTSHGNYIYRGFMTPQQQIDALLDHVITERGYGRFAVLYPDNTFGRAALESFQQVADSKGVTVVREQAYDPQATAFLDAARQLGDKTQASGSSDYARNPPDIDYDALFIPDNYQRSALVASSLAYEEFPVGAFRPTYGSHGLLLMGLNSWNNDAIVEAGGQYLQGSIFVDAFWSRSADAAVVDFVSDYEASFGRKPGIIDAVTYDTTRLLSLAVKSNTRSRSSLLDALSEAWLPDPVSTGNTFGADRQIRRSPQLMTITTSGIRPWSRPE
jgi:ABC-type branched-subunit amino acid transport system substrate-binding protein